MSVKEAIEDVGRLQTQLNQLLDTISSSLSGAWSGAKPWNVEEASAAVWDSCIHLEKSLEKVKEHQKIETVLSETRDDVGMRTEKLRSIGVLLNESEKEIEAEILRANQLLYPNDPSKTESKPISVEWVLQLARKLSYTTHAPPGWHFKQMRPLPDKFHPPAPQMEEMKRGKLFKQKDQLVAILSKSIDSDQNGMAEKIENGHENGEALERGEKKPSENGESGNGGLASTEHEADEPKTDKQAESEANGTSRPATDHTIESSRSKRSRNDGLENTTVDTQDDKEEALDSKRPRLDSASAKVNLDE